MKGITLSFEAVKLSGIKRNPAGYLIGYLLTLNHLYFSVVLITSEINKTASILTLVMVLVNIYTGLGILSLHKWSLYSSFIILILFSSITMDITGFDVKIAVTCGLGIVLWSLYFYWMKGILKSWDDIHS